MLRRPELPLVPELVEDAALGERHGAAVLEDVQRLGGVEDELVGVRDEGHVADVDADEDVVFQLHGGGAVFFDVDGAFGQAGIFEAAHEFHHDHWIGGACFVGCGWVGGFLCVFVPGSVKRSGLLEWLDFVYLCSMSVAQLRIFPIVYG